MWSHFAFWLSLTGQDEELPEDEGDIVVTVVQRHG